MLAKRKPSLVCAPSSSLHNGYGNFVVGKLPELMALGVNVAIGSDHASSGIVDMTQEVRLACCCYKEMRLNPRVMPPETGVEMATINGAKAALMADRIGSIEVGKEADVVLFDTKRPEWQPLINPVANLVYSATGDSVRDVFVAGEQVVADGTPDQDRREQALRRDSGRGDALQQAPQGRPDGAIELAGDVMDAQTEINRPGRHRRPGISVPGLSGAGHRDRGRRRHLLGLDAGAVRRAEAGQSLAPPRRRRLDHGRLQLRQRQRPRADRSRLGQGAGRPADHPADRDAFPSRPRRRLRLDRREMGPAPAHVAWRMAHRQPRRAQPQHRPRAVARHLLSPPRAGRGARAALPRRRRALQRRRDAAAEPQAAARRTISSPSARTAGASSSAKAIRRSMCRSTAPSGKSSSPATRSCRASPPTSAPGTSSPSSTPSARS